MLLFQEGSNVRTSDANTSPYFFRGVTYCSEPEQFYWFNPVKVLVSELLAGAQIALPSQVNTILTLLRIGSQIMYAFFMAGTILNLVLLCASPLVIRTRLFTALVALFALISAVLLTIAAAIATALSVAAKVALTAQDQLNINAIIGVKMFAFMWIGAVLTDVAFILHSALGCCCRPNRSRPSSSPRTSSSSPKEKHSMPGFGGLRHRKASSD